MVAKVFDDILLKGIRSGEAPGRTAASREWYRNQAAKIKKGRVTEAQLTSDRNRRREEQANGNMYFFGYDAKHKGKLPYYDRFPLIFPIGPAKGGFYGINFHYLPPRLRAQLMDALYDTANNDRLDSSTKLRISYDILKSASKFRLFKPAIKHYLAQYVRTQFVYVEPSEWDIALFLPTADFVGASKNKVYSDSRKIISG
jgi:hypothetical protein